MDSAPVRTLRLDRFDSRLVLQTARQIYFRHLAQASAGLEPIGIVITLPGPDGRVVFERPLLLPEDQFIPLEWILQRPARNRTARPSTLRFSSR